MILNINIGMVLFLLLAPRITLTSSVFACKNGSPQRVLTHIQKGNYTRLPLSQQTTTNQCSYGPHAHSYQEGRGATITVTFLLTIMSLRVNLDLDWNLIGNHSQMMIRQITLHWCNLFILAFLTQPITKNISIHLQTSLSLVGL